MTKGSQPADDGKLSFSMKMNFTKAKYEYPQIKEFVKPFVGANEFINGVNRYCLWITENQIQKALSYSSYTIKSE